MTNREIALRRLEAEGARLSSTEMALFEAPAVEALYQATQGLPRKVNRLAHYALSAAALAKARQITVEHLQAAIEEVQ